MNDFLDTLVPVRMSFYFRPMKKLFSLCLMVTLVLAANSQYKKSRIGFSGYLSYDLNFETRSGTMKIPKIKNDRSGGNSGTLRVEVWLMRKKYKGSLSLQGYLLTDQRIGELKGGYYFYDLNYSFDWNIKVPPGRYYVVYILKEYDPKRYTDYVLGDYLCFDKQVVVK